LSGAAGIGRGAGVIGGKHALGDPRKRRAKPAFSCAMNRIENLCGATA
jgi:hypothetical protein